MLSLHLNPDIRISATKKKLQCLSSVHHPFIDQRCPFRKADAKVDTFFTSTKYFGRKISKIFAQKSQRFVL